jgi:hypothetical protein
MVSIAAWESLTPEEQQQLEESEPVLPASALNSEATDGSELTVQYRIELDGDNFIITNGQKRFSDLRYTSGALAQAAFEEVSLNYNR